MCSISSLSFTPANPGCLLPVQVRAHRCRQTPPTRNGINGEGAASACVLTGDDRARWSVRQAGGQIPQLHSSGNESNGGRGERDRGRRRAEGREEISPSNPEPRAKETACACALARPTPPSPICARASWTIHWPVGRLPPDAGGGSGGRSAVGMPARRHSGCQ
jgi:hypothetical protein